MQVLRLYSKFVTVFMKSKLEYRLGFCVEILANFVMLLAYYLGIWVMFQNFDNIAGWNYQETLLLFNMNWLCYSISGFFLWAPMLNMGSYIQSGEFDSFLIRPMNTLVYLIFRQFQYTFIARLIMAIIFFTYSLQIISIPWTPVNIIYFIVSIVSGIAIHAGVLIIIGAISFWTIQNDAIGNFLINSDSGLRTFADYPLTIYGSIVKAILIFVIPYAFVNYFPTVFFLGKNGFYHIEYLHLLSPFVAVAVMILALILWNIGMKHYNSTGT